MVINGGSEICVMCEEVTREVNVGWKRTDWKMITADGNRSDLEKVAESVPVNVHGIIIPVPIVLAKSGSEQGILGGPREPQNRKCERNLDDSICEIAIPAFNESQQVTFVTTFPHAKRDRFASSSGNIYAQLK
jgi:hypothetical protein